MKPTISICIPTYNRAHFIGQTIESVLEQSYKDFELIIWNDGATDTTEQIVKSFKDKRIEYHKNEKNSGYITTMNKCTKAAHGEWIMHLSDDDLMTPTMLEEMVNALHKYKGNEIGFVVPQTMTINEQGNVISVPSKQLAQEESMLFKPKEFIYNFTLYGRKIRDRYKFNTSFPSTLFNKKILVKLGMSSPEVPVSHDILIESKICLLYPIIVVDKPLFKYRVHANWGSSLNRNGGFLKEYREFLKLLFQFVDENRIMFPFDFRRYCTDALISYIFSLNGGLVRLAARFDGSYVERIRIILEYVIFCVKHKASFFFLPQFYLSISASLLPQKVLLGIGKMVGQI